MSLLTKSSMISFSGDTEEIFNFIPSFEELQNQGEMETHTNSFQCKSTFAMVIGGAWYVLQETAQLV